MSTSNGPEEKDRITADMDGLMQASSYWRYHLDEIDTQSASLSLFFTPSHHLVIQSFPPLFPFLFFFSFLDSEEGKQNFPFIHPLILFSHVDLHNTNDIFLLFLRLSFSSLHPMFLLMIVISDIKKSLALFLIFFLSLFSSFYPFLSLFLVSVWLIRWGWWCNCILFASDSCVSSRMIITLIVIRKSLISVSCLKIFISSQKMRCRKDFAWYSA